MDNCEQMLNYIDSLYEEGMNSWNPIQSWASTIGHDSAIVGAVDGLNECMAGCDQF